MRYRQLTQTQRYQIHARYDLGISQRQIGRELGIHNSTVSRELRRNATDSGYDPEQAAVTILSRRNPAVIIGDALPGKGQSACPA